MHGLLSCCILCISLHLGTSQLIKHKPQPTPFQDWDYIVFTQRWPITDCTQWKEEDPSHTCNMPADNRTWIIHGVWPTKTGKKGPFFCNSSIHFDPTLLAPIEADLENYWTNIEANTKKDALWEHEWKRHGTCAVQLPQMNSVLNYFKQGLEWIKKYNMDTILSQANIVPNETGYTVENIFNAIKSFLNVTPAVDCEVDKAKQTLISEIRICFNKSLELIDCTGADGLGDTPITDCSLKKPVIYADKVPAVTTPKPKRFEVFLQSYYEEMPEDAGMVNFYKLLKFLMWFTL